MFCGAENSKNLVTLDFQFFPETGVLALIENNAAIESVIVEDIWKGTARFAIKVSSSGQEFSLRPSTLNFFESKLKPNIFSSKWTYIALLKPERQVSDKLKDLIHLAGFEGNVEITMQENFDLFKILGLKSVSLKSLSELDKDQTETNPLKKIRIVDNIFSEEDQTNLLVTPYDISTLLKQSEEETKNGALESLKKAIKISEESKAKEVSDPTNSIQKFEEEL